MAPLCRPPRGEGAGGRGGPARAEGHALHGGGHVQPRRGDALGLDGDGHERDEGEQKIMILAQKKKSQKKKQI